MANLMTVKKINIKRLSRDDLKSSWAVRINVLQCRIKQSLHLQLSLASYYRQWMIRIPG